VGVRGGIVRGIDGIDVGGEAPEELVHLGDAARVDGGQLGGDHWTIAGL
jgi:hypothetical protein